jgi:HlyD family secretion protein
MQLNASVNEADIGLVQAAQGVSFTVDAYGEQRFTGKVREVRLQPTTTNNVVTYTVVIDVPNDEQKLKPGMTATVSIEVARADDVVRIPAAALRFQPTQDVLTAINGPSNDASANASGSGGTKGTRTRGNGNGAGNGNGTGTGTKPTVIWTLTDGRLAPVRVTPGLSDGMQVAVLNTTLQPGTEVATGLIKASTTTAAPTASQSSSPLMPNMPRRGGR